MHFCDGLLSFFSRLLCLALGLFLMAFALLVLWALCHSAPWLVAGYVVVILAFLFVPPLRRWQDQHTPGWDWTRRKR